MKTMNRMNRGALTLTGALICGLAVAGCEVTNPGNVNDEFIALPVSQAGLVRGSWERMNVVINYGAYHEALAAREMFPGGQTGTYGRSVAEQAGSLGDGDWDVSGQYNSAQQARWIAEEAIRRFEEADAEPAMLVRAMLAAGYANKINGDYFCWGVIDGGPLMPGKDYWTRAEGHFTKALAIATDPGDRNAALAGRAQARLALGDWAGAAADAKLVPTDFVQWLEVDFSRGGITAQSNHVFNANGGGGSGFRSFTFKFTWFHDYYLQTGDPRTPWREFPQENERNCVAALQGFGSSVPCTQQRKYTSQDDDIKLANGAEMRLIEAEAMLRQNPGSWQAAMALINDNRMRYVSNTTGEPLRPWTANNLDDAWTYLMRERGIELWLEARRWTDMRRWEPYIREYGTFAADGQTLLPLAATTPGTLDWPDFPAAMRNPRDNLFTANQRGRAALEDRDLPRELCYNISNTERQNNPHFNEEVEP
jgi:hypothetical protein